MGKTGRNYISPNHRFLSYLRPASENPKDLFEYCVKKAMEKDVLSELYMHVQWAVLLFDYERNSSSRSENMSKVKREYNSYFTRGNKYGFDVDKIKRDFPYLLGIKEKHSSGNDNTTEGIIQNAINVLNKEIIEQKNPDNIESFKGRNLTLLKRQGKSYIYDVTLDIKEGQEPHFHDGIPFVLNVYNSKITCEAVDFDFESAHLFFTCNRFLSSASFCTILLDSTFILEGLSQRLHDIKDNGIKGSLPLFKFLLHKTNNLNNISHKEIPGKITRRLDMSQKKAFDAALGKDITFIWGPPGTGKSFTLAAIIYALYWMGDERTAICCLSNVAVDQLLCKLLDIIKEERRIVLPGNIYRAGRTLDARIIDTDFLFPNDTATETLRRRIKHNMERLQRYKERKRDMTEDAIALKAENKELRDDLKEKTESLIKGSRVVFSTISNFVLSKNLNGCKFDNLIVDEASMLAMPSLIALASNITKRLIMVGDFQQLSPIALVKDNCLTDSVFEMVGININKTEHPSLHQLLHQRRSNKKIVELINKPFYNDKLIATIDGSNEIIKSEPFGNRIIAVKKISNGAVRFTKGGTRQNVPFAKGVIELLDLLYKDRLAKYTIGVITPYKGQVALIKALKHERNYSEVFNKRIKIGTIHTFQGSECDVIIYDMVDCYKMESGKDTRIGKIYTGNEGERLLNVAVSRARHKLIIVCDPQYIRNIPGGTLTDKCRKVFDNLGRYSS